MSPKRIKFLFQASRILLILLLFSGVNPTSSSSSSPCPPSSCGNITNISFPFRLKSDPLSCGRKKSEFELDCQNNQTIMNKNSRKYYVQEINYDESWFRLVDPSINWDNLSACPDYNYRGLFDHIYVRTESNVAIVFIHCLSPLTASTKYVESAFCGNRSSISVFLNSSETYGYVTVAGEQFLASDLEESCAPGSGGMLRGKIRTIHWQLFMMVWLTGSSSSGFGSPANYYVSFMSNGFGIQCLVLL